jgi:hypothetical protein
MKIRILDDHVRLRLDRDEVQRIGAGGTIAAQTRFPDGTVFGYALRPTGNSITARFERGTVTVDVPAATALRWARDERAVAIEHEIDAQGRPFGILIEKDFECLEPRAGEGPSNRFPNPKAAAD